VSVRNQPVFVWCRVSLILPCIESNTCWYGPSLVSRSVHGVADGAGPVGVLVTPAVKSTRK